MNFSLHFRPRLVDTLRGYTAADFRGDFFAGLNAMVLARIFHTRGEDRARVLLKLLV